MIRNTLLVALLMLASFCSVAQNIVGSWSGELKLSPQMSLKLVFHIKEDSSITMDSPDQGAYGIKCETTYLAADSLNLTMPDLMMSYSGHLSGDTIRGVFHQGNLTLPLDLTVGVPQAIRPQTPRPPFPYTCEEVTVSHDDVTLAATLTIPQNASGTTPVVVMVSGSGQQNRDEEIFEHKPFAVIADYLARNGIASLRYDDRGMGGSVGNVTNATTDDFATDAESIVKFLRNSHRFGMIGLMGHSEGGLIAYKLGSKPDLLDFIVSIAGPAVRGDSILLYQNRRGLEKSGIPDYRIEEFMAALAKAFTIKINRQDAAFSDEQMTEIYPSWNDDQLTRQLSQGISLLFDANANSPWLNYFMGYSPVHDLRSLAIPTLIIYGGKDTQVPASLNASVARKYAPGAMVRVFPYANHLMQHAVTGEVEEYKTIEETISPEVLNTISTFINVIVLSGGKGA